MKTMKLMPAVALTSILMLWTLVGGHARISAAVCNLPGNRAGQAAGAERAGTERAATESPERGDVPGWVMITLMSAVLVAGLLAIAGPALEALFRSALDQVSQGK